MARRIRIRSDSYIMGNDTLFDFIVADPIRDARRLPSGYRQRVLSRRCETLLS